MSLETPSRNYGAFFYELSSPERVAAVRYIDELAKRYPVTAAQATAGPGNDGEVYVYALLPEDEDREIEMRGTAARITSKIRLQTGVSILMMSGPE